MLGRRGFIVIAVVAAVVGAHSLNPRELYNEMYPVEALKRDAFHICDEADPTFIRAVRTDREECFNSMPHVIAVALGRVRPGGALAMAALLGPSRQAEFLMALAAMPPRQPITMPRSFADTAWLRTLSPTCDDSNRPAVSYVAPSGLPPPPGSGRATALDSVVAGNLPTMPRGPRTGTTRPGVLPVIPLAAGPAAAVPAPVPARDDLITPFAALPAPDVGDKGAPAIVPLAPASVCSGA